MQDLASTLKRLKLIPVVGIPSVEAALRVSELLLNCRLPVIEITFRTSCASQAIEAVRTRFPEMLVLAGTVLSTEQARLAGASGCRAIVSPGFSETVAAFCKAEKLPYLPGVCTPSEVHKALDAGLEVVKFFPAEQAGGVRMLSIFASVFQRLRFMPTGGINPDNVKDYLNRNNVLCCGGTWLCPEKMMAAGEWSKIEKRVTAALDLIGS